jgi:hypothetical protein
MLSRLLARGHHESERCGGHRDYHSILPGIIGNGVHCAVARWVSAQQGLYLFCLRITHGPAIGGDADSDSAHRSAFAGNLPARRRCPAVYAVRRRSFQRINFQLCCMHAED